MIMVQVGWKASGGPLRGLLNASVLADTGISLPKVPVTVAEMQAVAYAAKMALIKVLIAKSRGGK